MPTTDLLDRFHAVLVNEIRAQRPELLTAPFTVAEIYQELVPYRTHRDRLGVEMNGDYEHALIRLLAGEGDYLVLEADTARQDLRRELKSPNPNTGLFRDYAAADVRLNPERVPGLAQDAVEVDSLAPVEVEAVEVEEEVTEERMPEPGPADDDPQPAAAAAPEERMAPEPARPVVPETEETEGEACKWCRATLPNRENLNYCPFCGTDVNVVPCPSCGEALEPEWRFCIACGAGMAGD
ncbi:MAG TPA: zinc ribbon domain-containing protein [Longimicrobiales bacterium]|nr:zinc ribbon domain-containing protein [Longimicrobiales bacterium]